MSDNTIYLVTGAAGFLGSNVCRLLAEREIKTRALILPNDPAGQYLPEEVQVFEGNFTDKESMKPFFTIPEDMEGIVLHIGSIVALAPDFNQKIIDVNVGGTKNIIDLCLTMPRIKKLVYCSSTGAIPELPKGTPIKEVDYFDETKVLGCYSMSKAMASQEVLDAVHHRGLNACIVHPSGILGPYDYAIGEITKNVIDIINGNLPAGIDGNFNLCDVRDLAMGIVAAAEKGRTGECYILANDVVSFKDFTRMITDEGKGKKVKLFLPIFAANMMSRMMETTAEFSGKEPALTSFQIYNLARNNEFDYSKAKNELGYRTRPYEETIHDQINWYFEAGILKSED